MNYDLRFTIYDLRFSYNSLFTISLFHHFTILLFLLLLVINTRGQESLTLPSAISIGLENNFSVILQKNEEQIMKNNNTIGNAGFLPQLGLTGTQNTTFSNTHQEQFSGTTRDVSNAKNTTLSAGAYLNWTLFDGTRMFVNKKMFGIMEDLGENGSRIVIEQVVSQIILNYYAIIQLKKLVVVAQEAVDLSVQRKRIAEAKLSLGAGSQLMLLQSVVDLNADSTRLIRQNTTLANTKADLNRLLSRDVTTPFDISDSIPLNFPYKFDSLLNLALQENTQLISARLNQELSKWGVREAQSQRYPGLDFNAGYGYNRLNSATGFLKFNESYGPNFGFNLSWNLFNGFNVNREIKNAKILMNSGDISVKDNEQELRLSLFQLYNQYLSNLQIVKMQLTNVEVAQENVDVAFEKYKLGSINDVELREIQQKQIDAEYQLILSTFEAKQAEVGLIRLSGGILKLVNW